MVRFLKIRGYFNLILTYQYKYKDERIILRCKVAELENKLRGGGGGGGGFETRKVLGKIKNKKENNFLMFDFMI